MPGYEDVTYGALPIYIVNMRVRQIPATKKQKIGRVLVNVPIIGLNAVDYQFEIEGMVTGTTAANLETNRLALEALNDSNYHALVTGISNYDGNYIINPDSFEWADDGNDAQGAYRYRFTIIQYNQ